MAAKTQMTTVLLRTGIDAGIKDSFVINALNNQTFDNLALCRTNYHRIFLINEGHGNLQADDKIFPLSGSELFLLGKGQLYSFLPDTSVTGYELCFGDCFWERSPASANNCKAILFNDASANQHIPVEAAYYTELDILFSTLHKEFVGEEYTNKPDALAAWLKIIMIKIANINAALTRGADSHGNQIYHRFVELVSKHYKTTHEVAYFSDQLGITPRKLTDLCKLCAGKGAKDIINGQIISEAKRSLQFSSTPVKEIAFQLNFSSPDQFSHFFKKNTQSSPNEYRSRFVNIGI